MTSGPPSPQDGKPPTLWQVIGSVLASFFGVQSAKNRERDFSKGKAETFIVVGLVMTAMLVLTILLVVKLVLHNAGM